MSATIGSASLLAGREPDLVMRAMEMQCRRLRSLVQEEGLTRIDAITLDVAGVEDRILVAFLVEVPHAPLARFMIV